MRNEEVARDFWNRVDNLWSGKPLKDLASSCQVDYVLFLNWRTKHRLPDLVSACNLAKSLGTCAEHLTFGQSSNESRILGDVMSKLRFASEEDVELVKRVLRISSSNSEQKMNA